MKAPRRIRKSSPKSRPSGPAPRPPLWKLRLYIAGQTPRSLTAFANLQRLCEEHLAGRHEIEVIDLVKSPELGKSDQIIALPTLVRKVPEPVKRLVGDLSNSERVLFGIDLIASPKFP